MKWCPQCKKEQPETLELCPDCEGELDDAHPDPELVLDATWVTVAKNTGLVSGQLILAAFEQAEIPAEVVGGQFDTVKVYEGYDTKIKVPKRFFDQAKEIADQIMNDAQAGDLICSNCGANVSDEDTLCPECGESFGPNEK